MNRICFYSNQILPIIGIHYEKCQQIAIEAITSQCFEGDSSHSGLFFIRFFLHITPNFTRLESIWSRPIIVRGFQYFCYIAVEQIILSYVVIMRRHFLRTSAAFACRHNNYTEVLKLRNVCIPPLTSQELAIVFTGSESWTENIVFLLKYFDLGKINDEFIFSITFYVE